MENSKKEIIVDFGRGLNVYQTQELLGLFNNLKGVDGVDHERNGKLNSPLVLNLDGRVIIEHYGENFYFELKRSNGNYVNPNYSGLVLRMSERTGEKSLERKQENELVRLLSVQTSEYINRLEYESYVKRNPELFVGDY